MKLFTSFLITVLYAILFAIVYFAVTGFDKLLASFGLTHVFGAVIIVAYFLYIWRDSYKKLTKEA